MVTLIESDQAFKSAIATGVVIVDFFAVWCGPCNAIAPIMEKMAAEMWGKVKFLKVDVDKNNALAAAHEVRAMPTFIIFVNGKPAETIVGANQQKLRAQILHHAEANKGATAASSA